ncbi:MAG TPA: putative LPS assembly protein LptD [Gemmatimonadaceae bacterium]|nr:putative LPS assembly protein LptD [Gemmatimonadaceae bacterium]
MRRGLLFGATAALIAAIAPRIEAQVRRISPPPPVRRDTTRVRPDSLRSDSTRADSSQRRELIKWGEPDSVLQALMNRPGYTATRYQGDRVTFDAQTRTLHLEGDPSGVQREQTVLVADTIFYNDSTKRILARGDTVVLRDPSQNAADVVALGEMRYNVALRRGTVSNISTSIAETGENWYIGGRQAAFVSDTSRGHETAFYVRNGSITSCDDSIPDYHFESKEIKMVSKHIMVARPAVLYIGEVPVMWLPFIFQDMRSGRRSGVLTPRFGVSELFRNSPTYRRHAENLGYYFAISDYMDAQFALDWRSGARTTDGDPGYVRLNGDWQYRWLDRFLTGRLGLSHQAQRDGSRNTAVSWSHNQDFSQNTHLSTSINYVTNTFIQRITTFNPAQVLATIRSTANYQTKIGPASLTLGGDRTQFPGRREVSQNFPNFSISAPTLSLTPWLEWQNPTFQYNTSKRLNVDEAGEFAYRYITNAQGNPDSVRLNRNTISTGSSLNTPIKIGGFTWTNSFTMRDEQQNAPVTIPVVDPNDSSIKNNRVFARTFSTGFDWSTSISLPSFLQNSFRVTPSVSFANVSSNPFWLRTEQSGGRFVHQSKRVTGGLSATPTLFALFPGFGPVTRFRHSINPSLTYSFAPPGHISTEYLRALNKTRQGYVSDFAQNSLSLGLSHVLEAKLRSTDTSSTAEQKKVKILSMTFSPIQYDFERARKTHLSGFTTDAFNTSFSSDLIPGFNGSLGYSLYQGDISSDTSQFKPFRTDFSASFTLNGQSGIFGALNRVFGRAVPQKNPQMESLEPKSDDALASRIAATPVAGVTSRDRQYSVPQTQGWQTTINFTSSRQRPPTGNGIVIEQDPTTRCAQYQANPIVYQQCITLEASNVNGGLGITRTTAGAPFIRTPPRSNAQVATSFSLTPKWTGNWTTNYDFVANKFGSHQVTLQRELHDWRAIFSFTQAPNGNFAFTFFIALNAEPDLKFNYDRQTYRPLTP